MKRCFLCRLAQANASVKTSNTERRSSHWSLTTGPTSPKRQIHVSYPSRVLFPRSAPFLLPVAPTHDPVCPPPVRGFGPKFQIRCESWFGA
ncbi:hypothetical protein OPV22_013450 [Ensete ventricosum]|uniref:Uncharacterized protein n=1 Tax=Ensete ventricosum TaxID=4639 RepID=A0AAV8R0W5_ENSVE|nr:hypothetical protein OPV22_013450 [Ensete ventricosum]